MSLAWPASNVDTLDWVRPGLAANGPGRFLITLPTANIEWPPFLPFVSTSPAQAVAAGQLGNSIGHLKHRADRNPASLEGSRYARFDDCGGHGPIQIPGYWGVGDNFSKIGGVARVADAGCAGTTGLFRVPSLVSVSRQQDLKKIKSERSILVGAFPSWDRAIGV